MHFPLLLAVAWPWSLLAWVGVAWAAVAVLLLRVGLLARSGGELAAQLSAAGEAAVSWRAWRSRASPLAIVAVGAFVMALVVADSGSGRAVAAAAMVGVVATLAASAAAHHFALLTTTRVAAAAGDAARLLAREGASAASGAVRGLALLAPTLLCTFGFDATAAIALAAAATLTAAALASGRSESGLRAAVDGALEAAALQAAFALAARDSAALALGLATFALAFASLPSRLKFPGAHLVELLPLAIVPLFASSVDAADGVARITVPLVIGFALMLALRATGRWLRERSLADPSAIGSRSRAGWLLAWHGAAWMVAWRVGGDRALPWVALAAIGCGSRFGERFTQTVAPDEAAGAAAEQARLVDDHGRWFLAFAGLLCLSGGGASGAAHVPAAVALGALLLGVFAGEVLAASLRQGGAPDAISTRGGARAMIAPSLLSVGVAVGLSKLAPALQGSVVAGMLVVSFLAVLPAPLAAREGLTRSDHGSEARLVALVPWLLALVFLALAAAPHGR